TANCSPAPPPRCCRWRSDISCTEIASQGMFPEHVRDGFSGFAFDPAWSNVPPGILNPEEKPGGFLVIYVVATLTIKPETRAEFIAAATACIKETRREPGNIAYDLHESVTDPAKMVFVEQWESAEALVPHRAMEHMKT